MKWLYTIIRKIIPAQWHGFMTTLIYGFRIKPSVNRTIKSPFNKGTIILSADFEMAWAFRYSKTKRTQAQQMGIRERENIPELIALFEKYRIPVTWATVGHLFLNSCIRVKGSDPHPEMLRPGYFENSNWQFKIGDWYQQDPCSNYKDSPAWYAPDLIDLIISSNVNHEIGCHTFSHCDFSNKNCTPELARAELKKCKELAKLKGIELKSMVFPGGTFGNYEILKEQNFTCYRFKMCNHIDLPFIDRNGLVAIPSSLGLDKGKNNWSASYHLKIIDRFLEKTKNSRQVCHFWFHPSMASWYIYNVFPFVLEKINNYRLKGDIEVLTMGELANKFRNIVND